MQVLEDLPVGLEHAGLVVGDGMISTESFDDRLRFSQLVAGQPWKQVVFDLVVQAAIPEVGDRMGDDVPACQYLPAHEVELAVPGKNGHGFVVRSEDRDHEHPKESAMDGDEQQCLQGFQHGEQQAEVHHEVCSHEECFGQRALCSFFDEKLDAATVHAQPLQNRERKDEGGLVFHDEAREPSLVESLLFFEGEEWNIYVGVRVQLVRMTVMVVVLVDPPLAAYAEQQVAKDEGEPVVLPGGAEGELPMPEVVGYKADLDEDEGQIGGVQELKPEIVEDKQ